MHLEIKCKFVFITTKDILRSTVCLFDASFSRKKRLKPRGVVQFYYEMYLGLHVRWNNLHWTSIQSENGEIPYLIPVSLVPPCCLSFHQQFNDHRTANVIVLVYKTNAY